MQKISLENLPSTVKLDLSFFYIFDDENEHYLKSNMFAILIIDEKNKKSLMNSEKIKNVVQMIHYLPRDTMNIDELFMLFVKKNYIEIVKYLVFLGANIHAQNNDRHDAVQIAAARGHIEMVKYLVSMSVNIHADNDFVVIFAAGYGHIEMVKYLVSIGANIRADNDCAVRLAARVGHLEMVKYLVSLGTNIRANNDYAVHWAAQEGHLEMVKYLVSLGAVLNE